MEIPVIQTWAHMPRPNVIVKPKVTTSTVSSLFTSKQKASTIVSESSKFQKNIGFVNNNYTVYNNFLKDNSTTINVMWNSSDVNLLNASNTDFDYDYHMLNSTMVTTKESWALCKEWTAAQHNLFQTANFFFAAAFLVPCSFKQSVLLVR